MLNFQPNLELLDHPSWVHQPFSETLTSEHYTAQQRAKFPVEGLYIFWWTGSKELLEQLSRKVQLKGKMIRQTDRTTADEHVLHDIEFSTDWFPDLGKDRYALYVGKSTDIFNRFKLHRYRAEIQQWPPAKWTDVQQEHYRNRDHHVPIYKPTTASQFRSGWQSLVRHLDSQAATELLHRHVEFSYLPITGADGVATRFYLEDYLIGALRPWFNLDSER